MDYLKDLQIGEELKGLITDRNSLTIVGDKSVTRYYETALKKLNKNNIEILDAGHATIKGHHKILNLISNQPYQTNQTTL